MTPLLAAASLLAHPALQQAFVETRRVLPVLGPEMVVDTASGDVDGDGDVDLFLARTGHFYDGGARNGLLLHHGVGWFEDGSDQLPPTAVDSRAAALADLDGDGDLDAYVGNGYETFVGYLQDEVLANDGTGVFTVAWDNVGELKMTLAARAADVDLDGDVDVAVAYASTAPAFPTPDFQLLRNTGAGLLLQADPTAFPALLASNPDLALGDLDGDGVVDTFLNGTAPGGYAVLTNDGSGVFTALPSSLPDVSGRKVDLGDVDGDGDLDAYLADSSDGDELLLNDGSGSMADGEAGLPPISLAGFNRDATLSDFDGDGDLDVIGLETSRVFMLANDGGGAFTDVSRPGAPFPLGAGQLAVLDVDDDLDPDLVLFKDMGDPPHLWLNADGVFAEAQAHPNGYDGTGTGEGDCALGDLNGDGAPDILSNVGIFFVSGVTLPPQRVLQILINSGHAVFADLAQHNVPPSKHDPKTVDLADVDGDGDLDALLGFDGTDVLHLNDGGGGFQELAGANPLKFHSTVGVATGDLDGDGDIDQISSQWPGLFFPGEVHALLGDGSGLFTDLSGAVEPAYSPEPFRDPVLVDVDADGDLDLALPGGSQSQLHLNDGAAVFQHAPAALPGSLPAWSAEAGDLDADGDADLVLGGFAPAAVLANGGTGVFSLLQTLGAVSADNDARLIDYENDGDLDVLAGKPTELFLNDGAGGFTAALGLVGSGASAIPKGHADFDGDRDVDLLFADAGRLELRTRVAGGQVVWRTLPRVGKTQHLEVFGEPGTPWALAAALAQAHIPLAPFGTLLLDPATLVIAASGSMPGEGLASIQLAVPNDPGLIGATVWWQALTGSSPRLTNADPTTLTGF